MVFDSKGGNLLCQLWISQFTMAFDSKGSNLHCQLWINFFYKQSQSNYCILRFVWQMRWTNLVNKDDID